MAHAHEGIWILAEQRHGRVQTVSYELLARAIPLAKKRNTTVSAMLFGHAISDDDANQLIARGADRVVVIEDPALAEFLVEPYA